MDTFIRSTLVLFLCGLALAEHPTSCPEGYTTVDHMCYAVIPLGVTWPEAQSLCDAFGGDVLEIDSDLTMGKIVSLFNQAQATDTYWLDANDIMVPGTWKYSGREGSHLTYTKWASGQPSGQRGTRCVTVQPGTSSWVAKQCTDKSMAICQIKLATPDIVG